MRLLVIIVNYRTGQMALDCLRSLEPEVQRVPGTHVVMVDNASGDNSVPILAAGIEAAGWSRGREGQHEGGWCTLRPMQHNGGFAWGNNQIIREALTWKDPPDFFLLLNPDTLVHPGALEELMRFAGAHPRLGIAGSRLEDGEGQPQCSAHRLPSLLGELDGGARLAPLTRLLHRYAVSPPIESQPHRCDWVSGASMLVRREVLQQIGLLDEGFFLYWEEVDFGRRATQGGWEVWYVPASRIVHLEGTSTQIQQTAKRRARYWYDSRRRFFVKAYGVVGLVAADLAWWAGRATLFVRRMLRLGGSVRGDPKRFALDLLWGDCKAVLNGQAWAIDRKARPS